jgi:UPF0755 protein
MSPVLFDQEESDQEVVEDFYGVQPERRKSRLGRWLVALSVLVVFVLVVLGLGALWIQRQIDPPGPPGAEVVFNIPSGSSTSTIADKLAEADIVSSGEVFRWYLRLKGGGPFEAGQYHLRENSAMGDVVKLLEKGPDLPPAYNLTIPEGLWVSQIAKRVDKVETLDGAKFLELANGGTVHSLFQPTGVTTLEGLLFPETYRIEEKENEEQVLQRLVDTFDEVASELGYADAPARVGVSPYEAIIVASLVESEAKVDDDRAKIARVIYNRLAQNIPLGIDATFYYALGEDRRGTSLRQSDLEMDSPYNTRTHTGLVPTPIAVPGRASLEAAMNPEPGDWLYYVLADDQGHHAFSSDYNQFLRDKRAAQENGLIP